MLRKELPKEIKDKASGPSTIHNNAEKYNTLTSRLSRRENIGLILLSFIIMVGPPIIPILISLYLGMGMSDSVVYVMINFIAWFAALVIKPNEEIFHIDIMSIIFMAFIFIYEIIFETVVVFMSLG